jgi:non-specific serine/threonine protein kinase
VAAIEFDDVTVDPGAFRVLKGGRAVPMEPKAFVALLALMSAPGVLVTKDRLLTEVWPNTFVAPNTLTRVITQLRRALGDDSKTPRYIETVHTRGYRFVGVLRGTEAQPRIPRTERAASSLPHLHVPSPVAALIGRDEEVDRLKSAVSTGRMTTLVGPGGVGKTQLALEAARQAAGRFADGVCFVDLSPYSGADVVPRRVAAVLDMSDPDGAVPDQSDRVAHLLRDRRLLLLLDNCEHVVDGCRALAAVLLRTCTAVSILATSQRPLGVGGESIVLVQPLATPRHQTSPADDLADLENIASVRLFVRRAGSVRPSFALDEAATRRAVADICRRLDGVPLAIEMAAARLNVLGPEQIAARLEDRFALLTDARTTLARHQTLQEAMDWSYQLLPGPERALLQRLSVFAGGWSLEAAESVCGGDEVPRAELLDVIAGLIDRSFVVAEPRADGYRYKLQETIRAYARSLLDRSGGSDLFRARHFEFFSNMARHADSELRGAQQSRWLATLDLEHGNLTAAHDWVMSAPGRRGDAMAFAVALRWYWRCRSRYVEARTWLAAAIAVAPRARKGERARALVALSQIEQGLGSWEAAQAHVTQGLGLITSEQRELRMMALGVLAVVGRERRQRDAAMREALQLAEGTHDPWSNGFAHVTAGLHAARLARHRRAAVHFSAARRLLETTGDRWLIKYAIAYEGFQRHLLGDQAAAAALVASALHIASDLGDRRAMAACLEVFGYIAVSRRRFTLGCRLLGAADSLREVTGVPLVPLWLTSSESARNTLRRTLGRAAAKTWEMGRAAPLQDLIDDATRRLAGRPSSRRSGPRGRER